MVIQELQPELSTATTPSEPIQLLRIARNRILPGKRKEWEVIVKNELLPAYRKAGYGSFTVRRVRFGALTESRELNVYRFRQDLSFSAQK